LNEIRLLDTSMTLVATDGRSLALPLSYPVREITLKRGTALNVRKHVGYLAIEPKKNG
jgi:hypothetical protein